MPACFLGALRLVLTILLLFGVFAGMVTWTTPDRPMAGFEQCESEPFIADTTVPSADCDCEEECSPQPQFLAFQTTAGGQFAGTCSLRTKLAPESVLIPEEPFFEKIAPPLIGLI